MVPDRRARRRLERRQAVVDAALRLLARAGEAGLTMPALAAELDIAVGGLYTTFPSKDALLVALQLQAVADLGHLLDDRVAAAGDDPLERVRAAFGTWSAWARSDPALFALVDRALSDPARHLSDEGVAAVDAAMAPILGRCAALLHAAIPGPDPDRRALAAWSAVRGARQLAKRDDRSAPGLRSDAVEAEALEALLRGWLSLPRPRPPPR